MEKDRPQDWALTFNAVSTALQRAGVSRSKDQLRHILRGRPEDIRRGILAPTPHEERLNEEERIYPMLADNPRSWIGRYLRYASPGEAPLGYHFWVGLAILGCSLRRNLYIDNGLFRIFPAPYIFLVGPTGSRKSTTIDTGIDLLVRMNDRIDMNERQRDIRTQWTNAVTILPGRGSPETILLDNLRSRTKLETLGGQAREVYHSACGFLAQDEATVLIGRDVVGSSRMIANLTDLYGSPSRTRVEGTRRWGTIELRNTSLTVVFGSTQEWIRKEVNESMLRGGFLGRFLFIPRWEKRRKVPRPRPLDPVEADLLAQQLTIFAEMRPQCVRLDGTAERWFDDWYNRHADDAAENELMRGYLDRRGDHLLRVALLLGASEKGPFDVLTASDLERAWMILRAEERLLPRCFEEFGEHGNEDIYRNLIRALLKLGADKARVSHSALLARTRGWGRIGGTDALKMFMATLVEQKIVTVEPADAFLKNSAWRSYRLSPEWLTDHGRDYRDGS